jgi:DnaK suppressor protein
MKKIAKKSVKTAAKKVSKAKPVVKAAPKPITNTKPFQDQLEIMRDDLLNIVRKKKDEVIPEAEVGDEADVAVRSLERDLVFEMSGNELHMLEEVEAALRRIEKKIYGLCEANGELINEARLKAMPYARYCINCQSRFEHH